MAALLSTICLLIYLIENVLSGSSCSTPVCLKESTRLNRQIDSRTNPCEDFYEFACGKFLRSTTMTDDADPVKLMEERERYILDMCNEPVRQNEHPYVKSAKKLFKSCMDTQAIEADTVQKIKEVFKKVGGGWPILEGPNWDATKFDWVQATYKLRELGYPFNIFLDVLVNGDPRDKTKNLLKLRIPFKVDEGLDVLSDNDANIKKILQIFGATPNDISRDLSDIYRISEELKKQILEHKGASAYPTYKISMIQTHLGKINWLEFLNRITRPALSVTKDDYVIFVEENSINSRLEILSKTPKRTLANYMFWKVLERLGPYLTSDLRNYLLSTDDLSESRAKFCLKTVQEKFIPNPLNILYAKRILPDQKRNVVRQIVLNIRDKFIEKLEMLQWMSNPDKQNAMEKAKHLIVIVGEPENYFSEDTFDHFSLDMIPVNKDTFLNLLAQANRNLLSNRYSKITKSKFEKIGESWFMGPHWKTVIYSPKDNVLRIPTVLLQDKAFDVNNPYYITYGTIGKQIGEQISEIIKLLSSYYDKDGNDIEGWSRQTTMNFRNASECIIRTIDRYREFTFDYLLFDVEEHLMGTKLAHDAYETWTKVHGEESKLANLVYTPLQLFWISTVVCKQEDATAKPPRFPMPDLRNFTRVKTYAAVRNNPAFGKDFNCIDDTAMNPPYRCPLI